MDVIFNILLVPTIRFVYFINEKLYSLILTIGDIDLFRDGKFQDLNNRVFIFAGIFILFKMSISIINYVLDPDKLMNSSTGVQKIIMRLLIAIAMLTAYDAIFTQAMRLQQIVLEDGIITQIVFGEKCKDETLTDEQNRKLTSNYISYTMIAPFIHYNDSAFEADASLKDGCDNSEHKTPFVKAMNNMDICSPNDNGNVSLNYDDACYNAIWETDTSNSKYSEAAGAKAVYRESFEKALSQYDFYSAWVLVAETKKNGKAVFTSSIFTPILALAVAIILFIICVRVAVRSIKLAFLRLMAPIPIISYVDIKGGEKGLFSKWLKTTINTYLELFIQLLALYFAIFIISQFIGAGDLVGFSGKVYSWESNPFLNILMIVACFMFALQLPKLIQDMTGLDTSGIAKVTDKIGKSVPGAVGAVTSGALGLGTGAIMGGIAGAAHFNKFNKDGMYKDKNGNERGGLWKGFAAAGNVIGGVIGGGVTTGATSLTTGFNKNKSSLSLGNVASSVYAGQKRAQDTRNAQWAIRQNIAMENGEVKFDANGKVVHENARTAGFGGSLFEQVMRPTINLTGNDTTIQQHYKDQIKQYDEAERKLRLEASQLNTNYEADMQQLNQQNNAISQAVAKRTQTLSMLSNSTLKVANNSETYNRSTSDDGSIAYKFRHLESGKGLSVNFEQDDIVNGTYGLKIDAGGGQVYDLGTMSYQDYEKACISRGLSYSDIMSDAEFQNVQADYRTQIQTVTAQRNEYISSENEINTLEQDRINISNKINADTKAITENSNKLEGVRKAKEAATKARDNVEKAVKKG